ncbi:MAG: hypothetical protein ACQSGP_03265 [Frankia sp.]
MRRILLSPSWWLRHVLMIVLVGLFLRLGWWQFQKGRSRSDLQNLFYGIEWPFFAGCVIFGWCRMIMDELGWSRPEEADPSSVDPAGTPVGVMGGRGAGATGGLDRLEGSASGEMPGDLDEDVDDEEDIELAEYNRYLAALAARDDQRSGR